MIEFTEELAIADKYVKEMLEADDSVDFELYIKRYEKKYLGNFSQKIFISDIEHMHKMNGMHTGYELLGALRNYKIDGLDVFRSVWKGIYENRDAVIEMEIYKKNDVWHIIKSAVH